MYNKNSKENPYKLAVLGATFTGCGLANIINNSIVLERGAAPGYEYAHAFYGGKKWDLEIKTPLANKFQNECLHRNIVNRDKIHIPALIPLLSTMLKGISTRFKFLTEIISWNYINNLFEIEISNFSGIERLFAQKIIDTRSAESMLISKFYNALLHSPVPEEPDGNYSGNTVSTGLFPAQYILSIPLAPKTSWPQARNALHAFWKNRDKKLQNLFLSASGTEFACLCRPGPEVINNITLLPSTAYDNPAQSMEAGEKHAEEMI